MSNPVVSVLCVTYNHAGFIRDCLEGFVKQKCDFDFEVLIHDDASTDGTQEIIKEYWEKYPDIIKPILQTENQWSKKAGGMNLRFNYPRARGKYIALCDGDDFWIDEKKLQKQVTFLENNPDFSVVCSAFLKIEDGEETPVIRNNKTSPEKDGEHGSTFDLDDHNKAWFYLVRPSTTLFRNVPEKVEVLKKYEFSFDVHLFYHLLKMGEGYYSKEVAVGCYHHQGGVHSGSSPQELILAHYYILKELYETDKNEVIRAQYLNIAFRLINLKISGLMPSSKIKNELLKTKNISASQIYKEIKPLLKTKAEQNRLYKSYIPYQLKLLKSKSKKLLNLPKRD
ncbi:MAG TPA: glycosyltransferase family 2 protein [Flavobacteriaceae bacterium]|nr:glycosyltransferase family 2 protein [Flavobacteriaceae bacterium]